MKKIIAIAVLGMLTLASCKKDYTCTYDDGQGTTLVAEYNDYDSDQAEAQETSCNNVGGTWEEN